MENVGKNILTLRKKLGWTQEDLARRVGYTSKSTINKIEMGSRDLPQKKIKAFADALGVTPAYLMGWEYEASPERDDKKEKPSDTEGLSENHIKLIEFAKSVPEDKAEMILRVMRSIVEDGQ